MSFSSSASAKGQRKSSPVKLQDVAAEAGVSPSTASLILSGKDKASEETRKRVWEAARKLEYKRTKYQESAEQRHLLNIAFLFSISPTTSYSWHLIRSYIEEAQRNLIHRDGSIFMYPCSEEISDQQIYEGILRAGAKGVISFSYYNESLFYQLEENNLPVVVFNNMAAHKKFNTVTLDDFGATYEAVRYLIGLGHKKVIFVYTERYNIPNLSNNRFYAYQKALAESGIDTSDDWVLHLDKDSFETARVAFADVVQRCGLPLGVVCLDDEVASGVYHICTKLGLRVPEDISLIAHGDLLDYSRFQTPAITTMKMDPIMASKLAINLLVDRLMNPSFPIQTLKTQGVLFDRGSCARLGT